VTHTLRRARLAVALTVGTVIVLSTLVGCGAGFDAQTKLVEGPEGTQAEAGDILIRNAQLVAATDDGSLAALVVGLVNKSAKPDALTEIKVGAGSAATVSTLPPGGLALPPGALVSVGSQTGPSITVQTDPGVLAPGATVQLTLGFRVSGGIQLSVPVQEHAGPYATVSATPIPTTPIPTLPIPTLPIPTTTPSPTGTPAQQP
jgi:copper(I)-binding protein